jgi:hypothetical protein
MDRSPAQRRVGVLLGHVSGAEAHVSSPLVNTPAWAPDADQLHLVPTHASVQAPAGGAAARPLGSLALKPGDTEALTRLLDHDNHDMRGAMKAFMKADLYKPVRGVWADSSVARAWCLGVNQHRPWALSLFSHSPTRAHPQRYDMPLRVERELALERLAAICDQKFFSVRGRRARGVAQPIPAFPASSATTNQPPAAAALLCAAHACDDTATALTRAAGAPPRAPAPRWPCTPPPGA